MAIVLSQILHKPEDDIFVFYLFKAHFYFYPYSKAAIFASALSHLSTEETNLFHSEVLVIMKGWSLHILFAGSGLIFNWSSPCWMRWEQFRANWVTSYLLDLLRLVNILTAFSVLIGRFWNLQPRTCLFYVRGSNTSQSPWTNKHHFSFSPRVIANTNSTWPKPTCFTAMSRSVHHRFWLTKYCPHHWYGVMFDTRHGKDTVTVAGSTKFAFVQEQETKAKDRLEPISAKAAWISGGWWMPSGGCCGYSVAGRGGEGIGSSNCSCWRVTCDCTWRRGRKEEWCSLWGREDKEMEQETEWA